MPTLEESSDRLDPVGPRVSRRVAVIVLVLLGAQFLAIGLLDAWNDSPTYDEATTLSSGLTILTRHQIRITTERPPLAPALTALPVLLAHPIIPNDRAWRIGDSEDYSRGWIRAEANAGAMQRVTFLGRIVPLLLGVATGLGLYALGASIFGRAAGLLAAGLWLTLPFTIGLAHTDVTDVAFALTTVLTCLALLRFRRRPVYASALIVGLACGVGLLVRLNALAVLGAAALAVLLMVRAEWKRAAVCVAIVLVVAWASVWLGYRALSPRPEFRETRLSAAAGPVPLSARLTTLVPWPREFRAGVEYQAKVAQHPASAYLLGEAWTGQEAWYYPASLLVKLPATTVLVVLLGFACWWRLPRRRLGDALLTVALPVIPLTLFVVVQPRQIGLRYLLPTLALAFVATGPAVRLLRRSVAVVVGAGVVAAIQLASLWTGIGHSLAWTAPPFHPGYQVATDSNLDWGQDLYLLRDWAGHRPFTVVYFGTVDPRAVVRSAHLATFDVLSGRSVPYGGVLAVSASDLTAGVDVNTLSWLRAYCPVDVVGDTMLIYRFDRVPDRRPGPDEPASPCPGPRSRRTR